MNQVTQREAVYTATRSVLTDQDITFEDGDNITTVMTDDIRKSVHAIVCESFKDGTVVFKDTPANKGKLENDSKLSSYVSGLISNWFRKDKRFNGNTKYAPKNPGSRAGQGDAQLKALRQLHKKFSGTDDDKAKAIQGHIDTRVAEIQAAKANNTKIDLSVLPTDLIDSLGLEDTTNTENLDDNTDEMTITPEDVGTLNVTDE